MDINNYYKRYSTDEIIKNSNLIFDLKNDIAFKRVFLNDNNLDYFTLVLSKLFNLDKYSKFIIRNNELASNNLKVKSSYTDLIIRNKSVDYIIEMNQFYTDLLFYKNHHYLFKQHSGKCQRKNTYGKYEKTILINIDNFDYLKKNQLIYKVTLNYNRYNLNMYKNIEYYNINLDYLRKKYYNEEELNEFEKLLIIFIEQKKDKILKITNDSVIRKVIKYMDTLKYEDNYIATYDKEEFDLAMKEEFENNQKKLKNKENALNSKQKSINEMEQNIKKLKKNIKQLEKNIKIREEDIQNREEDIQNREEDIQNREEDIQNREENILNQKEALNKEKVEIAKELKKIGFPINKIVKLTKLSLEQIHML